MDLQLRGKKAPWSRAYASVISTGKLEERTRLRAPMGKPEESRMINSNARVTTPGISSTINVYLEKTSRGSSPMGTDRG